MRNIGARLSAENPAKDGCVWITKKSFSSLSSGVCIGSEWEGMCLLGLSQTTCNPFLVLSVISNEETSLINCTSCCSHEQWRWNKKEQILLNVSTSSCDVQRWRRSSTRPSYVPVFCTSLYCELSFCTISSLLDLVFFLSFPSRLYFWSQILVLDGFIEVPIAFWDVYKFFRFSKDDVSFFDFFKPNNFLVITSFLTIDLHQYGQRAFRRGHTNE